jgi:nitroreductase
VEKWQEYPHLGYREGKTLIPIVHPVVAQEAQSILNKPDEEAGSVLPDMERMCGASVEQFAELNQTMFNAPAVVYVCMDKALSEWSLYDIGAYSQTLMLAAIEHGLSTIPAITLTLYPDVLRRELQIPSHLKITIGIAVGYADKGNGINNFVSARKPLDETIRFFE